MSLDELVSVIALVFYTISVSVLTIMTLHQAHERWGMPFPRYGIFRLPAERWIRHHPGTNGRWKLDWAVSLFLAVMAIRNCFTIKYLIQHGRPATNWTFTTLYILHAVTAIFLMRYIRAENIHRKEETENE